MTAADKDGLDAALAACGVESLRWDPATLAIRGVTPLLAVAPGSTEEASRVMALTAAAGLGVVPVGGGTAQSQGAPPGRPFVTLHTGRLCRVLRYEPGDLTISIEAGATLAALAAVLRPDGLMLPVDAPLPARATLGGMLATAADGPRRLGYGTLRDLLIGITVVEPSGRISKAGGLVVKNVSGFDLMKLYLGSQGTLALIVSANFKLLPIPRSVVSVQASFARREEAFAMAAALGRAPLLPVAVEYVEGPDGAGPTLAVRAEGHPAASARHLRDLRTLAEQAGAQGVTVLEGEAAESFWAAVADLPQTATLAEDEVVLQVRSLPAAMAAVLDQGLGGGPTAVRCVLSVRALSGVAYLRMRGEADAISASARRLAGAAHDVSPGAQLAVLGAAPALWQRLDAQLRKCAGPPDPVAEDLMHRLRAEFDPQGRCNPGRLPRSSP